MPGCAAVGCNNRSEKGYIMKCFPRDPKLRKIWQDRVARADWVPSNNSFLCHVHFEADEWCIAENGRVKLKKDAVPSIFTVTSTRKSPKKRKKLRTIKDENNFENKYATVYVDNDTEHSSISQLEEKDSDSQDDPLSVRSFVYQPGNHFLVTEHSQALCGQYRTTTIDLQRENMIIISDDNTETHNIRECDAAKQENSKNIKFASDCEIVARIGNLTSDPSEDTIKTEIKRETDRVSLGDSYDEIEEKLKQICDGYHYQNGDSDSAKRLNSSSESQTESSRPFHRSINYRYSSRNEIGDMLTGDTDNVEIIFGTESGEECMRPLKRASYNNEMANATDKLYIDNVNNNKEKSSLENVEAVCNEKSINVSPNIKIAMKRKWRTREQIMKSIEKSFASTQRTSSVSSSEASENVAEETSEVERKQSTSESTQFDSRTDTAPAGTKFTVKVTGDPDDVFDIMQNFYEDVNVQKHNGTHTHEEDKRFVTSVITIDDCAVETNARDSNNDFFSTNVKDITWMDGHQTLTHLGTSTNDRCPSVKLTPRSDELNNSDTHNDCLTSEIQNVIEAPENNSIVMKNDECRKLVRKIKMQQDVIKKLTDQLISCKSMEKNLKNKCSLLEKKIERLACELTTKASDALPLRKTKENANSRQVLIDDITNRLTYFEEANKKLVKTISAESQQRKKFEGQIKQRDNRIKELNWKLEKASKFLERAEKNTNTYRRKMLNMQTFIRRKKLLEEKMSKFNQILIDSVKECYIGKTLSMEMATDVKKTCGINGYERLLGLGFPLPMLTDLRSNGEGTDRTSQAIQKRKASKIKESVTCSKAGTENTKESEIVELIERESAWNETETVTGTVQDILEESSDCDDFSVNELTENFIAQLQATM